MGKQKLPLYFLGFLIVAFAATFSLQMKEAEATDECEDTCKCWKMTCGFDVEGATQLNPNGWGCRNDLRFTTYCVGESTVGNDITVQDADDDGICNHCDNCPGIDNGTSVNPECVEVETGDGHCTLVDQADTDRDGVGNACDNCLLHHDPSNPESCALECVSSSLSGPINGGFTDGGGGSNLTSFSSERSAQVPVPLIATACLGILALSFLGRRRLSYFLGIFALAAALSLSIGLSDAQATECEDSCKCFDTECKFVENDEGTDFVWECELEFEDSECVNGETVLDTDGDDICDHCDNCPSNANGVTCAEPPVEQVSAETLEHCTKVGQEDTDNDGHGDVCDTCPLDHDASNNPETCQAPECPDETPGATPTPEVPTETPDGGGQEVGPPVDLTGSGVGSCGLSKAKVKTAGATAAYGTLLSIGALVFGLSRKRAMARQKVK
jgi:hypothetical protein